MTLTNKPLLTIAIPTYNRAYYLSLSLEQIFKQIQELDAGEVEVLVSDNASDDDTSLVIEKMFLKGLNIRYEVNSQNIGGDANVARCFDLALGNYVLILGDDDLFVDGGLIYLMKYLRGSNFGVVCMRPYGYDLDFRDEFPGAQGSDIFYDSQAALFKSVGQYITLISAVVINKKMISDLIASSLIGVKLRLVQVELIIVATLRQNKNLYLNRYLIACKRNNTAAYDFFLVFVENLSIILDSYKDQGLLSESIYALENKMLVTHFPLYLYRLLLRNDDESIKNTLKILSARFLKIPFYKFLILPIFKLPRFIAKIYILILVVIGRVLGGDFRRGLWFLVNSIGNFLLAK